MDAAIEIFTDVICERFSVGTEDFPDAASVRTSLRVILDDCVRTIQQSDNLVWQSLHGNPSGNPLTTEFNCTVNFLYHWYCFRRITGKPGLRTFHEEMRLVAFGDDAIYTVQDVKNITFEKIAFYMNELGQEYTNAAKTGQESALTSLNELSFLKRNFSLCEEMNSVVLAPIETDSIEGQFNYCSYNQDAFDILEDSYDNALVEACMVGKDYFTEFESKMYPKYLELHKRYNPTRPYVRHTFRDTRIKLLGKLTK
jgi:hypothetical protein